MQSTQLTINRGLEGVVVAATAISDVRGAEGDLAYRGRSISEWVEQEFSTVAGAIVDLPAFGVDLDTRELLFAWGELTTSEVELVLTPAVVHPMAALQALVPLIDVRDAKALAEQTRPGDPALAEVLVGLMIAARMPHALATVLAGEPVSYPDEADYVRRLLLLLGQDNPSVLQCRALSVTQILQLEHSLNAGTFTARVIASTQAGLPAALSGALGALSGVLHGGADQAAIEMADEVGNPWAAEAYVQDCLAAGKKIMGMGHREYKVVDPRGRYVKELASRLVPDTPHAETFATLQAIETAFGAQMRQRGKAVHPNLEFYKGVVYRALGAPDHAFTALFALARVFGYVAHVLESRDGNRIIRPAAVYCPVAEQ